ncbi:MAG: type II toxin-antitoxin system RelE/ParE family toxin [Alphaproteobacteria bacterium]|nr:type II toxin-antitoxin system RelE/ParE family toxin [Alphaproteobacteria bacterium]
MRLEWTDLAASDLIDIRGRIAGESEARADAMVARLRAMARRLPRLPRMGRPGRRSGTRELSVFGTPYFIVYRIAPESVQVLRVIHSRRNWPL